MIYNNILRVEPPEQWKNTKIKCSYSDIIDRCRPPKSDRA